MVCKNHVHRFFWYVKYRVLLYYYVIKKSSEYCLLLWNCNDDIMNGCIEKVSRNDVMHINVSACQMIEVIVQNTICNEILKQQLKFVSSVCSFIKSLFHIHSFGKNIMLRNFLMTCQIYTFIDTVTMRSH